MTDVRIVFSTSLNKYMEHIVESLDLLYPDLVVTSCAKDQEDYQQQRVDVTMHVYDDWEVGPPITTIQKLEPGQRIGLPDDKMSRIIQLSNALQGRLDSLKISLN